MSAAELRARPIPGKWSTHEVICHLADFEIINAERIMRLVAEENPTVFNAEPDGFTENLCYQDRDTEAELALIDAIRRHMATILHGLLPVQWQRTGTHSTDGLLSVPDVVGRVTNHISHHIRFIAEKRAALGR
jgi:hypothetical protein